MTLELALRRALAPLSTAALARGCELVCEVMAGVGEYVLGDRRELQELVARVAAEAVGAARGGDVHVRVARQYSGLSPSGTVIVSVSIRRADAVEDVACVELALPVAERPEDRDDAQLLASVRVLIVVPTVHAARVQSANIGRFGALVDYVLDASSAHVRMRDARSAGAPFDVLYLDERAPHLAELLRAPDCAVTGGSRSILATALGEGPLRRALAARVDETLSKPVLPRALCEAVARAREPDERDTQPAPPDEDVQSPQETAAPGRRVSGLRDLRLAEVLASLAVATRRRAP